MTGFERSVSRACFLRNPDTTTVTPHAPVKSSMVPETIFKPNYLELTATVPAELLPRTGKYTVVVKNPPPEGGTSNVLNFFVAR